MTAINRGFVFEDGDPSVGIFGGAWFHDDCPSWRAGVVDHPDEIAEVDEEEIASVRRNSWTVRAWFLLTCTDCAQQTLVYDDQMDPSDDALARAEQQAEMDAWSMEAMLAAADDDPNPYHGTYSEC